MEICIGGSGKGEERHLHIVDKFRFHVPRHSKHDIVLGLLVSDRYGRYDIRAQIDEEDRHGAQPQGDADDDVEKEGHHLGHQVTHRVRYRLLQVVEDQTSCITT